MRTKITLEEFIFSLNQDEDIRVEVIDYEKDETVIEESWKSDLNYFEDYQQYKDWIVNDFVLFFRNNIGVKITIIEPSNNNYGKGL